MKTKSGKFDGQIVIVILLVMVVVLVVALSAIGRSIGEISTATKTEESSRAFSAAEAGIEQVLQGGVSGTGQSTVALGNNSSTEVNWNADLPPSNTALEHPEIGKDSFAQFWLADPENLACGSGSRCYTPGSFELYFGKVRNYSAEGDLDNSPAVEVRVLLRNNAGEYYDKRYYYDSYATRLTSNNFRSPTSCSPSGISLLTNNNPPGQESRFYCQTTVPPSGVDGGDYRTNIPNPPGGTGWYPVMVRVRLLYSNNHHPLAIRPLGSASLPYQAKVVRSVGSSGSTQRAVQVFQQKQVLPPFLDFALFSAGSVAKN